MMGNRIKELADLFLAWPLPESVCSDHCVTVSGYPHQRSGTNLLTAAEARKMLEYLFANSTPEWTKELEAARVSLCQFWVKIADDPSEGGARFPELGRKALETEQALTLMADILCPFRADDG